MKFTQDFSAQINRLKEEFQNADAIVIGAGAGLSTAAGFTYSGERFERYFSDFAEKYGFHDMYSGGFYPYDTPRDIGRIGRGISSSIATQIRPNPSIASFSNL